MQSTTKKIGQLFIGNEWIEVNPENYFDVINPATEEVLTEVAQAGDVEVDLAVQNAREAFEGEWSKISARERGRYLYKLAELLRRDLKDFAELETLDNGKPISETLNVDLPLAIECFEYFAGMADKIEGENAQ